MNKCGLIMKPGLGRFARRLSGCRGERGFGLVETLMAIALAGTAVTAFVVALSTGSIAVNEHGGDTTAQQLAQSQLEYIKSYAYDSGAQSYPVISTPAGYGLSVGVSPVPGTDSTIQKVSVNVTRDGQLVLTIDDYKVDR